MFSLIAQRFCTGKKGVCECVSLRKRIKKLIPCMSPYYMYDLKNNNNHPLTYNNNSNTDREL